MSHEDKQAAGSFEHDDDSGVIVMDEGVEIVDEPFDEAINMFSLLIEQEYGVENGLNFIINDPTNKIRSKVINFNARRSMPTEVILRYLCQKAGATFRYGTHAVEISPAY